MLLVDFKPQKKDDFNLIGKIKIQVVIFLSLVAGLLILTQFIFAADLATDGQNLSQTESEIKKFKSENATLRVEIAKDSSLTALSKKAEELGFKKPQQVITP